MIEGDSINTLIRNGLDRGMVERPSRTLWTERNEQGLPVKATLLPNLVNRGPILLTEDRSTEG